MSDSALLPVKNKYALIGYYVSIVGFIPIIGFPGSVVALIYGILGLQFEKKTHVPGAKVHAIIAVVLGSFLALIHMGLSIIMITVLSYDSR
jgi:hypothetical protein